jgi:hypothetical protein
MTENYNEMKWNTFEVSGKIADYLQFKGISTKSFTDKAVQSVEAQKPNNNSLS